MCIESKWNEILLLLIAEFNLNKQRTKQKKLLTITGKNENIINGIFISSSRKDWQHKEREGQKVSLATMWKREEFILNLCVLPTEFRNENNTNFCTLSSTNWKFQSICWDFFRRLRLLWLFPLKAVDNQITYKLPMPKSSQFNEK